MGLYNTITCCLPCPHCDETTEHEVESKFGKLNLIEYSIGEKVCWTKCDSVKNGGKPATPESSFEGYTQCSNCNKDFFVKVIICDDIISKVVPDASRNGFI